MRQPAAANNLQHGLVSQATWLPLRLREQDAVKLSCLDTRARWIGPSITLLTQKIKTAYSSDSPSVLCRSSTSGPTDWDKDVSPTSKEVRVKIMYRWHAMNIRLRRNPKP